MAQTERYDRIERAFCDWARFVLRHRWQVVVASLLVSAALVAGLARLRADFSSDSFLLDDDRARRTYDHFRAEFGREDVLMVGLAPRPPREIIDLAFLETLRAIHREIEREVPHVEEVTSLVNARSTLGRDDELVVEDLLERWPDGPEDLARLRERVLDTPAYLNQLVSADLHFTTILVELETYSSDSGSAASALAFDDAAAPPVYLTAQQESEAITALQRVAARHRGPGLEIHLVGGEAIGDHIEGIARRDAAFYAPASILLIGGLLALLFRRVSAAIWPVTVVFLSMLSAFGAMGWLDLPFSTPTQALITFLMAVGTCDAVHLLAILYQGLDRGLPRDDAIVAALGHTGLPIVLTSLTTAGGLFSFVAAEISPVANLGIVSPIGVLIALAYTLTLLPAGLGCLPLRGRASEDGAEAGEIPLVTRVLGACGALAIRRPRSVLAATGALVLVASFGVSQVRLSDDALDWLFADDPMRLSVEAIDRALGGIQSLEVVIDTGEENGLYEPRVMRALEQASDLALASRAGPVRVGAAVSILDILRETHRALNENRGEFYAVPDERALIAQELLLFENSGSDDLEKVTDPGFQSARLSLRVGWTDGRNFLPFLDDFDRALRALFGAHADITITGAGALSARAADLLLSSLARSYGLALAIITPLMILLLGSLRRGLLSMIPNLLPLWLTLGLAGVLDIPLNMSTLMCGSMLIGVAVDDTIHFMHQFGREHARSGDAAKAIHATLSSTGSALFVTSLVLAASFALALLGHFNGMVHFGALAAFATVVAFLADVIVAPAIVYLAAKETTG